jgi:hypothetical protein
MGLADPDTIYIEDCDGVTTSETWKTEHAHKTTSLNDHYPVILRDGDRVMIDWEKLVREEKEMMEL